MRKHKKKKTKKEPNKLFETNKKKNFTHKVKFLFICIKQ